MLFENIPAKLHQITFNELVELADVKPSRIPFWIERGLIGVGMGGCYTLREAIRAAAVDAMESLELPPQFGKPAAPHILHYLVRACPFIVHVANANYSGTERRASVNNSLRSRWLEDVVDVRPKRFAAVYESIYLRIVTKSFVKKVEYSYDYDIVDLAAIATAMASRVTRPLVELRAPDAPARSDPKIEWRAGC